jgi:hypothetical protein
MDVGEGPTAPNNPRQELQTFGADPKHPAAERGVYLRHARQNPMLPPAISRC